MRAKSKGQKAQAQSQRIAGHQMHNTTSWGAIWEKSSMMRHPIIGARAESYGIKSLR